VAADPQHLGARVGVLAVLHTWGQQLEHHPHVHGVVPGGGLSATGDRWVPCRPNFFLPVKVLGRVFRGKYLAGLRDAYTRGALHFGGSTATLAEASVFAGFVKELYRTEWVVYAKEPFGGPGQVLKYRTGYTHRVALSNRRLVRLEKDQVTLTWKDYAAGCAPKELTLPAVEFVRRFALHILPKGLVRIRQYGLLANRGRRERLTRCRALLGVAAVAGRESVTPESPAAGRGWRPWLGPYLLVVLLSGILGPAEHAALTTALVASLATWGNCPDCGVGRPETIWRRERPTGRELTEQWEWDTS
jgi:hypothetical protein